MFPNKFREILEQTFNSNDPEFDIEHIEPRITKVLPQLLTLIESELLPKEKLELPAMKNGMSCSQCGQNYHSEDIGYNKCLREIKEKMK